MVAISKEMQDVYNRDLVQHNVQITYCWLIGVRLVLRAIKISNTDAEGVERYRQQVHTLLAGIPQRAKQRPMVAACLEVLQTTMLDTGCMAVPDSLGAQLKD